MSMPVLKLRQVVGFPGNILGGTGIAATKLHGTVTIDMAWNEFGLQSAIPSSPTNNILTFDTATNQYVMIPSSLLGGAVAGIADAPVDGIQYGRQSAGWTPVTAGNFIQAGTGAVTRTMQDKARDFVTPQDFGAVADYGTGNTDNTSAFQKALNTGRKVYVPEGNYRIAGEIDVNLDVVRSIHLEGAGPNICQLFYEGGGKMLRAHRDSTSFTTNLPCAIVSGLTLRKNSTSTSAIGISIELDDSILSGQFCFREVSDIEFISGPLSTSGDTFAVGINWKNANFTTTRRIVFISAGRVGSAVRYEGNQGSGDNHIQDLKCLDCNTAIEVNAPNIEGFSIHHLNAVLVNCGIAWSPATPKPWLKVEGSHINIASDGGIAIWANVGSVMVSSTLIYLGGTGCYGILMNIPPGSGPAMPQFSAVTIARTGGTCIGVFLGTGTEDVVLSGITFYGLDIAVQNLNAEPVIFADDLQFVSVSVPISGAWKPPSTSFLLQEVATSAVTDKTQPINSSGKVRGKMILVPDYPSGPGLYWAIGGAATDSWFCTHNFSIVLTPV